MAVSISNEQARFHLIAEAAAVAVVVPFMAYIALQRTLPTWARATAGAIGVATLIVDGILFTRYARMPNGPLGDRIPGGKAAGRRPGEFDPVQLRVGTKIELEHTPSRSIAREIAMDHLAEDPRYYTKLCRIHDEPSCRELR